MRFTGTSNPRRELRRTHSECLKVFLTHSVTPGCIGSRVMSRSSYQLDSRRSMTFVKAGGSIRPKEADSPLSSDPKMD